MDAYGAECALRIASTRNVFGQAWLVGCVCIHQSRPVVDVLQRHVPAFSLPQPIGQSQKVLEDVANEREVCCGRKSSYCILIWHACRLRRCNVPANKLKEVNVTQAFVDSRINLA
jgi:hypothetical protein